MVPHTGIRKRGAVARPSPTEYCVLRAGLSTECDAFYNPRQYLTRFRLKTFGVFGEVRLEVHPQPQPGADPRGRDAAGSIWRESLGKSERSNLLASVAGASRTQGNGRSRLLQNCGMGLLLS